MDWKSMGMTVAVAAVTSIAAVFGALAMRPAAPAGDIRAYLLEHPEVIPEAMARLQERETGKTVGANRSAILNPVGDAWIGNPKADVTLVEYFDYNCGYCRASLPTINALVKADPNVRVVFREMPVLSQASYDAAKLSWAAAQQGKFRAFHDALYKAGPVTAATMAATARAAGVDLARAKSQDAAATADIKRNLDVARQLGMTGTPSWVIGNRVVSGALPLEEMLAAVKAARAR